MYIQVLFSVLRLPYCMLFAQAMAATRDAWGQSWRRRMTPMFLAATLCMATLATPYGVRLHMQIGRFLGRSALLASIDEYQALDFKSLSASLYVVSLLSEVYALGRERQPIWRLAAVILAAYAGLTARRNVPFSGALLAICSAESIDRMWSRWSSSTRRPINTIFGFAGTLIKNPQDRQIHIYPFAALLIIYSLNFYTNKQALFELPQAARLRPIASALAKADASGGVLCDVQDNSALSFILHRDIQPLIDDRFELFTDDELIAFQSAQAGRAGWES